MAQKTSGLARHALVAIPVIVAVGAMPSVQGNDGTYAGNVDESIEATKMQALRQMEEFTQKALTDGEMVRSTGSYFLWQYHMIL